LSCEQEIAAALRASGQKLTPQRLLILTSVRHARGHITANEVLDEVRRTYPFIDASTVYRTLGSARELHLVTETNLGSGDNLFEWVGANRHHHLICRACGGVNSIDEQQLQALFEPLQIQTGFQADLHHIAIFGTCAVCQERAAP